MGKLLRPTLFSKHFSIDTRALSDAGLIDPFLEVDTELFIDPILLHAASDRRISHDALCAFQKHFEGFVRLLAISEIEGDVAWRGARKLLTLQEPPENGLGYGSTRRSGTSRPHRVRESIMRTAKEIIILGSKDPEMISLMGFFEEDVGPDTISDFTTSVVFPQLAAITEEFCERQKIPIQRTQRSPHFGLPWTVDRRGRRRDIVLVPRDIVRELPIANDWSEIEKVAFANEQIRQRVNEMLAHIARPTISDRKVALRTVALSSAEGFESFLETVRHFSDNYDPNEDALGFYKLKDIIARGFPGVKQARTYDVHDGFPVMKQAVADAIGLFRHHVENGNLWEELWIGDKPKRERASQLIFYAIAEAFCIANNVDISPEANMGGGPVDFKFSKGYSARIVVEFKRSDGQVRHGYERQLEIYKKAAKTVHGIFVVMDYGDLGQKLAQIESIRNTRVLAGGNASEIIVIDATKKASASRRS